MQGRGGNPNRPVVSLSKSEIGVKDVARYSNAIGEAQRGEEWRQRGRGERSVKGTAGVRS